MSLHMTSAAPSIRTARISRRMHVLAQAHTAPTGTSAKPNTTRCNSTSAAAAPNVQFQHQPAQHEESFMDYVQRFFGQGKSSNENDEWMNGLDIHEDEHAGHGHGMYISHLAERMAVEPPSHK